MRLVIFPMKIGRVKHLSIFAHDGAGRQARLINMRFPKDMHHAVTAGEQIVGDNPPVTAPPDGFGAHDCAYAPMAQFAKPRQAPSEGRGQCIIRVVPKAAHPPIEIGRRLRAARLSPKTTKFGDMFIAYSPTRQFIRDGLQIELRIGVRSGHRSDICNQVYARSLEQIDKLVDRPGRMTYCVECGRGGSNAGPVPSIVFVVAKNRTKL